MKEELDKIWASEYFNQGQRCFWLYNYNFFRIIDSVQFEWLNSSILHYPERAFAIADLTNGDRECQAILYFKGSDIYIQSKLNVVEPVALKKIAGSLDELFGIQDYASVLIKEDDHTFRGWSEQVYYNYEIERSVPKGVLPNFDLRLFFKDQVDGTFLSNYKAVNIDAFMKYFESFGVAGLDREKVVDYTAHIDDLSKFIKYLNARLGSDTFYAVWFQPSAFLGIGNFNILKPEDRQRLDQFGILGSDNWM